MALSKRNIEALGHQVSNLLPSLDMIKQLSNALLLAKNGDVDNGLLQHRMAEGISAISNTTEQLYRELDLLAFKLINCDNDKELEELRKKELLND
ncbi:hypothetical protein ACJBW9_08110 [Streptococcus suis]|nr:hypothetical protein [Streptococcus suis]MBL6514815.1 hypothetical protein [Streptococcus suis]HEL1740090.1 hypothetical protein [Streptococcus suis]